MSFLRVNHSELDGCAGGRVFIFLWHKLKLDLVFTRTLTESQETLASNEGTRRILQTGYIYGTS